MTEEPNEADAVINEVDERSVAHKYGIKELSYPAPEQLAALAQFVDESLLAGRCATVPEPALIALREFLDATLERQHITKGPRMPQADFDLLQAPYYLVVRVASRVARQQSTARQRASLYQNTQLTINRLLETLRDLADPHCPWPRSRRLPDEQRPELMLLRAFATEFPRRRKTGPDSPAPGR